MPFTTVDIRNLNESPIKMIADDWGLVTAGTEKSFNTMTFSWGCVGELWGREVAMIFIRPHRFTYEFAESNDYFTMCFFDGGHMKELSYCGKNSGRDVDKIKETGLTPVFENGYVYFSEAKKVIICKKIAVQDMNPSGFIDNTINESYPNKDYHRIFIGEILKVMVKI